MKLFYKGKDGGPESKVTGYWLIESKKFFSIALLRFDKGSRESYHNHAFHAISWVLWGALSELVLHKKWTDPQAYWYKPSLFPIITPRSRFHRVFGDAPVSWALTFRGPWVDIWNEYLPSSQKHITLTHGRKEL